MVDIPKGGSAAQNPDLNWSQVQETILMLGIVVAQVRHAMEDSSASLTTLANSFASTSEHIASLKTALLAVGHAIPAQINIDGRIAEIDQQNVQSIVAFQFFDRLSQRMDHVCGTISALASLVADRNAMYVPDEWVQLQQRIRSQYTMEQEKTLFDAILRGTPISEALALAGNIGTLDELDTDGGIELF